MSLEVFGDGGDVEDLTELAHKYGWDPFIDGLWMNEEEPGVHLTDEQMWQLIWDKREGDAEDYAEWEAQAGD